MPSSAGDFACHFEPRQGSKSSRTPCTRRVFRSVRVQTGRAGNAFENGMKEHS